MTLPARKQKTRMGTREESGKCPGHLRWVRQQFQCAIAGKTNHECYGPIEAHHVTTRGAGGSDMEVVPLCSRAHMLGHSMGWITFGERYGVDLEKMAAELWRADAYHRGKWELSQKQHTQP